MFLLPLIGFGQATLQSLPFSPNGPVYCQKQVGNTLYVGGNFSSVDVNSGSLVGLNPANPGSTMSLPNVNGTINTIVSDGFGGFFIGGSFSMVGGQARQNFARITPSMTVHPMNIGFNNVVKKIVTHNGVAYVIGAFDYALVNSSYQYKSRIAAISINTSTLSTWAGGLSSPLINDAVVANNKLYLGGRMIYNGSYRALLAYNLNLSYPTIIPTSIPIIGLNGSTTNAIINTLILTSSNQLYFGGTFNQINYQSRNYLSGINVITNTIISTNINLNNSVTSLAWNNNILFIAGNFTTVNGTSKPRLCAYNTIYQSVFNSWTPNPNNVVSKIGVLNGSLWVSGNFNFISNTTKPIFAAYTLSSNINFPPVLNTLFNVNPNNTVLDIIALNQSLWIAGGSFNKIGTGGRKSVMAINLTNNTVTNFAPQVTGTVKTIEVSGSNVFLGGQFTNVNGAGVQNFAVVNYNNGALNTSYKANFNSTVNALIINGSNLYVGGSFTYATLYSGSNPSGFLKNGLIAISLGSSLFLNSSFNANLLSNYGTPNVNVIKIINGQLFVGGSFTSPRTALASFNPINGSLNAFNANINNTSSRVNDLILTPQNELAIGGYLPYVGNNYTYNLAYVNSSLGTFLRSNYTSPINIPNSEVMALANGNYNDVMYVNAGGLLRTQNLTGASLVAYNQSGSKFALSKIGATYFIGGSFTYYNPALASSFTNLMAVNFVPPLAPTLAASNIAFSNVTSNSMTLNWTPGNGQNRIVMMRAGSPITSHPSNFTNYPAYNQYGSGSNLGGAFVVYNSNGNSVNVGNLQAGITYYVKIVEYNAAGITLSYASNFTLGQQATQSILPPTAPASNIQAFTITKNSMYLYCNYGNGNGRVIIARQGSPVNVFPSNNNTYFPSNSFGSGYHLGQGNFVISSGAANAVFLNNLLPGTTYHFAVFEYNSNGNYITRYKTDNFPTANFTTMANAPEPTMASNNIQVQNLGGGSANVTWTSGNGGSRILLMQENSLSNITSVEAVDGNNYIANSALFSYNPNPSYVGVVTNNYQYYNHRVVYNGTGNQATVYGLNSSTTYNFVLVEYNTLGLGSENYQQNQWATTNFTMPALVNMPNIPATNLKMEASSHNAARISWVNGNGTNRILVAKQGGPVNWAPSMNVTYGANSSFGSGTNYSSNFIVYNGTGNTANITNLLPYTDYHFAVYEFNSAYNSYTLQNEVKYIPFAAFGSGKTQAANWPRTAGGSGTDAAGGVTTDASGNVFVTGTFNGVANFGLTQVSGSSNQIFLTKYNSSGVLQWIKTAGGAGEDAASCVTVDNSGNSYIVGSFRNTALFDTIFVTSNGTDDAFIAKYNSQGVIQWVRTMGGADQDVAFWAKVDGNGDIAVTGYFHGSPTFSNSTQSLVSSGNSDIWVAKYGSNGNLIWSVGAGGNSYDYGHCLTIGANNSVIISGEYKTTATFGSTSLTNSGNESNGFIAKLSNAGGWQWAKEMGGVGADAAYAVEVDATDNYYVVGSFSNSATFGIDVLSSEGLTDGFISRVNSNGNFQWTRKFGGVSKDAAGGVSVAQNGNVYVSGSFANSVDMNGTNLVASGNQDILVATYTQTGLLTQATKFGGSQNDQARAIHAIDNTAIYLCGYFEGTSVFGGFEINASSGSSANQFNGDMFVHNIASNNNSNPSGDLISWFKFNGNHNDFSGNNFNGTAINSPVFINNHLNSTNSAVGLNGTQQINFTSTGAPQFNNLNELTYTGWVKINANSSNSYQFILYGEDLAQGISYNTTMLYVTNLGKLIFYLYSNPSASLCAALESQDNAIQFNTWTHLSATFKAGNFVRLYINGNLHTPASSSVYSFSPTLNNVNFSLGAYGISSSSLYKLSGGMDDVRLYKKALTQAEIIDIMNATSVNSAPPMEQNKKDIIGENPSVLYPNPSNGSFNLSFMVENEKLLSFRVIDLSGKSVFEDSEELFTSGFQIKSFDVANIQNGCYTLQVLENNRIIANHKVIVNQ